MENITLESLKKEVDEINKVINRLMELMKKVAGIKVEEPKKKKSLAEEV